MADTSKLGAELGEEFAQERTLGSAQEREAKQLIAIIFAREPRVKLPRILADERVQTWQNETGVTDAQLKKALTNARSERKANPELNPISIPPKRRKRTGTIISALANSTIGCPPNQVQASSGIVPNQDLALL